VVSRRSKSCRRANASAVYPVEDYRTPYEKLVSLPKCEQYLKPGITASMLQQRAMGMSDTEAALLMQKAKLALLAKSRGPT
jgi:hypothetical protein